MRLTLSFAGAALFWCGRNSDSDRTDQVLKGFAQSQVLVWTVSVSTPALTNECEEAALPAPDIGGKTNLEGHCLQSN
ncbi:hypothetical protein C8R43DRAFT_986561, partial [Mycena crocata]